MPEQERFPKFIGRKQIIDDVINFSKLSEEISRITIIYGEGGIGKTTILLKLKEIYNSSNEFLCSSIIDFSQLTYRTRIAIMNEVCKINPHKFDTYQKKLEDLHKFERNRESKQPGLRLHLLRELEQAFLSNLQSIITVGFKIILFFDTCEYIFSSGIMDFLLKIAANTNNLHIILAGRQPRVNNNQKTEEFFIAKFSEFGLIKRNYQIIQLSGFEKNEIDEYFSQSVDGKTIDNEMRNKIRLLTNGIPIKIVLSIEWLRRGINISDITEYSYVELEELSKKDSQKFKEIYNEFELELVDKIRILQSPIDDILLKMAHVQLRFNKELLNRLIQNHIKASVMDELKSLPFIKFIPDQDYFKLHDEFARLLNEYIWPRRDAAGLSRKELNAEVLKYYDDKINEFQNRYDENPTHENDLELKSFQIEQIYYQLGLDFVKGFKDFDELFDDFRIKRQEELADLAVQIVKRYPKQLTPLAENMLNTYYQGWVEVCRNEIDRAIQLADQGILNIERLLSKKYKNQLEVDDLLRERFADIYNLLGFCERRKGDWDKAIDNYERTLSELKKQLKVQVDISIKNSQLGSLLLKISETLNNIANVRRFQGKLEDARHLCHISLIIRENWGNELLQGKSAYVMGMILWELGGTAEAMKYLHLARELFLKSEGSELFLAWVDRYEGYIHYRIGFLDDALIYLMNAYNTYINLNEEDYLGEVCNDLARIYSDLSKRDFGEAEKYTKKAFEYSQRTNNEYLTTQCYLTLANRFYNEYQISQNDQLLQKMKDNINAGVKLSNNRYPLLESIFADLAGQVAAIEKQYSQAMEALLKACELSLKFKTAFVERAFDRLDDYLIKLAAENPTEALVCCNFGISYWTKKGFDKTQKQLVNNLNDIKVTINRFEQRKKLETAYRQQIDACEWEQAIKTCDKIVELGIFSKDEFFAMNLYHRAAALQRMEKRSAARRVCKTSISIFQELKKHKEEGDGHYLLGNIFWELGNTAEAAQEIDLARKCYNEVNYEPGKGYIARYLGHIYSRMGSSEKYNKYLNESLLIFKKFAQSADLADIYNIISRVARTERFEGASDEISFEKAKNYADLALEEASKANDQYRLAEAYLTLAIVHYFFRNLYPKKKSEFLKLSEMYLEKGDAYFSKNMVMYSIAIGIKGNLLYAQEKYDESILKYLYEECKLSITTKHMRLPRVLELLTEKLMRLPKEQTIEICNQLINQLQKEKKSAFQNKTDLKDVCELIKEYRPFIFDVKPKEKVIKY